MVKERIKEIVDFATTESPYKSANKGWINNDVYLKWGKSEEQTQNQGTEVAAISVEWGPINQLVLILILVFCLATLLVLSAISFSHSDFHFKTNNLTTQRISNQSQKASSIKEVEENISSKESVQQLAVENPVNAPQTPIETSTADTVKKIIPEKRLVTATDLFQPKRL